MGTYTSVTVSVPILVSRMAVMTPFSSPPFTFFSCPSSFLYTQREWSITGFWYKPKIKHPTAQADKHRQEERVNFAPHLPLPSSLSLLLQKPLFHAVGLTKTVRSHCRCFKVLTNIDHRGWSEEHTSLLESTSSTTFLAYSGSSHIRMLSNIAPAFTCDTFKVLFAEQQ